MTAPLTPAHLSEIRARAEAATAGPWAIWHDLDNQGFKTVGDADSYREILESGMTEESNPTAHVYTDDDAAFIAAARQDVPDLLSEVDRLTAAFDVAKTAIYKTVMWRNAWDEEADLTIPERNDLDELIFDYFAAKEARHE